MEKKLRLKNTVVHMLPFWWPPPLDLVSCVVWQFTSLCSSCVAWRLPQLTLNTMTLKLLLRTESRLEHLQLFRFIMYEEGCLLLRSLLHRNLQLLYPTSPSSSYSLSSPFIFWVKNKIEWKPLGKRQSDERTKKAAAAAGGSSRSAFQFTTTHLSSLYTEKLEMEVDIPRDTSSKRFVLCIVYPRQIFIV